MDKAIKRGGTYYILAKNYDSPITDNNKILLFQDPESASKYLENSGLDSSVEINSRLFYNIDPEHMIVMS